MTETPCLSGKRQGNRSKGTGQERARVKWDEILLDPNFIENNLVVWVYHPVPSGVLVGMGQSPYLVPKPLRDATKPPHWLGQTNSSCRIANTHWITFLHLMCTKMRNKQCQAAHGPASYTPTTSGHACR